MTQKEIHKQLFIKAPSLRQLTVTLVCILMFSIGASGKSFTVDSMTTVVDGLYAPFKALQPGDTLLLTAGLRQNLLIRNLKGAEKKPFVITNSGGAVVFNTDSYYGISIRNCKYFRLTGQGSENEFYGIHIQRVTNGAGIGINDRCSDFEIDHVFIEHTLLGGLYAKTDPDCDLSTTRDSFTQYNTIIHDNRIANVGNEGMYIGSTKYFGVDVTCNGKDTVLLPSLLDGVQIFNNIVEKTAWDGIQVSSASKNCSIWGNIVLYDSQEGYYSQMSGILLGGGSKCDCYNNYIGNGKGNGIESHGLGGYRIFNNIIVDAGRSYLPLDSTERKHGIFVTDVSIQTDSSIQILFNDIIRPKSDGIRFQSVLSKNNVVASNLIVDPGSFDLYEHGNTSFHGEDAYIMVPDPTTTDLTIQNNFLTRNLSAAGVSSTDFKPQEGSPLIDAATNLWGIGIDFANNLRPNGLQADIGAYEYDHQLGVDSTVKDMTGKAYPNPVRNLLNVRFDGTLPIAVKLIVYDLSGKIQLLNIQQFKQGEAREISVPVQQLPAGIHLYSLFAGNTVYSGKFIKVF